jgi:hypothetical protein
MKLWVLVFVLVLIFSVVAGFLYLVYLLRGHGAAKRISDDGDIRRGSEREVEHIFDDDFRQELRNRGRLHFEQILGESAMFLQQDLRLTTSELNEYMKNEISKELKDAFANYEQAIADARKMAVEAIEKTKTTIEEQRVVMTTELAKEVADEKVRRIKHFHDNMAEVVNHYVLDAIGKQIDLADQLDYIIAEMEKNKKDIVEDIVNGA